VHFQNISFKIDNCTFIALTTTVSVFDLGMSFRKGQRKV